MKIFKTGALLFGALAFSCTVDSGSSEDVDTVSEALGENACTTVPAPALGTTNNNIGYYTLNYGNCVNNDIHWSPSWTYNPSGCAKQYIVQLVNPTPPAFGTSQIFSIKPVWGGQVLTSSDCAASHLVITIWQESLGPFTVQWVFPAIAQFAATGHWESNTCVFRRDDNGSSNLAIEVVENPYRDILRAAVQARTNSSTHSVGVQVTNNCI
jgi:hypothetical protein